MYLLKQYLKPNVLKQILFKIQYLSSNSQKLYTHFFFTKIKLRNITYFSGSSPTTHFLNFLIITKVLFCEEVKKMQTCNVHAFMIKAKTNKECMNRVIQCSICISTLTVNKTKSGTVFQLTFVVLYAYKNKILRRYFEKPT